MGGRWRGITITNRPCQYCVKVPCPKFGTKQPLYPQLTPLLQQPVHCLQNAKIKSLRSRLVRLSLVTNFQISLHWTPLFGYLTRRTKDISLLTSAVRDRLTWWRYTMHTGKITRAEGGQWTSKFTSKFLDDGNKLSMANFEILFRDSESSNHLTSPRPSPGKSNSRCCLSMEKGQYIM